MKCLLPMLLLLFAFTTFAHAQDPFDGALPPLQNQPPRDDWGSQDPRYDTPKQAVQRKAAWKAAQRRQRLESMKRIGYSPLRPPTSPIPFMGSAPGGFIVPWYYPTAMAYFPRTGSSDPNVLH